MTVPPVGYKVGGGGVSGRDFGNLRKSGHFGPVGCCQLATLPEILWFVADVTPFAGVGADCSLRLDFAS